MDIELFTTTEEKIELCISEFVEDDIVENIPLSFRNNWISTKSMVCSVVNFSVKEFCIVFYATQSNKFYTTGTIRLFSYSKFISFIDSHYDYNISIGLCNDGHFAVWIWDETESILLGWEKGHYIVKPEKKILDTLYFNRFLQGNTSVKSREIIESKNLIGLFMQQFVYKINVEFRKTLNSKIKTNAAILKYLNVRCLDNTWYKINTFELITYKKIGKPFMLTLSWIIIKNTYTLFAYFDNIGISQIFDIFYGNDPETKTDFIIRIDVENKKYELALYRQGLKEPMIIPESAYQLIVFKNKFEDYRSENYNQPRGAWIW